MKRKFRNRTLPRGIMIEKKSNLVFIRKFIAGKPYIKCFGNADNAGTLDTAIAKLHEIKEQIRLGKFKEEDKTRRVGFIEVADHFLKSHGDTWKYHFVTLNEYFGGLYYDQITYLKVKGYREWRSKQMIRRRLPDGSFIEQQVKQSSINRELSGLSSMWSEIRRQVQSGDMAPIEMPHDNPVKEVRRLPGQWYDERLSRRNRTLEPDEVTRFIEGATSRVARAMVAALNTALSKKDLFDLGLEKLNAYGEFEGERTKVGAPYKVPTNDNLKNVFELGDTLDDTNFRKEFEESRQRFMDASGKYFQWRDLRRTALMAVYTATKDIVLCMELATHSDVNTTMRYLGITRSDLQKASQVLQNRFKFNLNTQTVGKTDSNDREFKSENVGNYLKAS